VNGSPSVLHLSPEIINSQRLMDPSEEAKSACSSDNVAVSLLVSQFCERTEGRKRNVAATICKSDNRHFECEFWNGCLLVVYLECVFDVLQTYAS